MTARQFFSSSYGALFLALYLLYLGTAYVELDLPPEQKQWSIPEAIKKTDPVYWATLLHNSAN